MVLQSGIFSIDEFRLLTVNVSVFCFNSILDLKWSTQCLSFPLHGLIVLGTIATLGSPIKDDYSKEHSKGQPNGKVTEM